MQFGRALVLPPRANLEQNPQKRRFSRKKMFFRIEAASRVRFVHRGSVSCSLRAEVQRKARVSPSMIYCFRVTFSETKQYPDESHHKGANAIKGASRNVHRACVRAARSSQVM